MSALRAVIRLRKKSKSELQEAELILATYMHALGMIDAMPDQAVEAGSPKESRHGQEEMAEA